MNDLGHRRVVTGLDADGRSSVIIDGTIPRFNDITAALVWRATVPADNSGTADEAVPYAVDMLHSPFANFAICEFRPGSVAHMHATNTIDYLVILKGRVTLATETGEVDLGPGDFVVDRGVVHGWRNDGPENCIAAVVNIPALPVGKGRQGV